MTGKTEVYTHLPAKSLKVNFQGNLTPEYRISFGLSCSAGNEKLSGNLFCAEKTIVEQNGVLTGNITIHIDATVNGHIIMEPDGAVIDLLDIPPAPVQKEKKQPKSSPVKVPANTTEKPKKSARAR